MDPEELRRRLGVDFEAENERRDLEYWREASDRKRSQVIAELIDYGEMVMAATGIRKDDKPAPRFPTDRRRMQEEDAS